MANMNRCELMGRVANELELKQMGTNKVPFVGLRIAVNRKYRDAQQQVREEVTFVQVELWGSSATYAAQYLKKGCAVHIEGRLRWTSWEGKDGLKHSTTKVICERLQNLTGLQPAAAKVVQAPVAPTAN